MSNRAADWGENAAASQSFARIQQLAAMNLAILQSGIAELCLTPP
jgi:hypothetical protein